MVDDTSVKTPMQRHREFAVSALIGVAALVVALLLKAPLPYSIGANALIGRLGGLDTIKRS